MFPGTGRPWYLSDRCSLPNGATRGRFLSGCSDFKVAFPASAVWLGGTLAMTTKGILAMVLGVKLRDHLPHRTLRTLASASCLTLGMLPSASPRWNRNFAKQAIARIEPGLIAPWHRKRVVPPDPNFSAERDRAKSIVLFFCSSRTFLVILAKHRARSPPSEPPLEHGRWWMQNNGHQPVRVRRGRHTL